MTAPLTAVMVDAIAGDSHNIPAGSNVAGYLTGAGIAWTAAEWDRFTAARVRILQEWTTDKSVWLQADALDIEARALTLTQAASIAVYRAAQGLPSTVYISASSLAAARAALKGVDGVTFWVANWSITAAEARALITSDIVAIQYASPDGGINTTAGLPGTKLTIKAANVDLSIASLTWLSQVAARWPKPTPVPAKKKTVTVRAAFNTAVSLHPKTAAGTIGAAAVTGATAYAKSKGLDLTAADTMLLAAAGTFITTAIAPARKKS